ncbi:DEAD/DEAH box helicase family protein [Ruegeria pomeroyi]|nr:DEAD/DEAH box helicase family protein [Ruegeria pomeroyi]
MQNLLDDLTALLQAEQAFISDGAILKNAVIEAALNMDARLLELLMQSDTIKAHFFTEVAGALVFDKVKFQDFVSNKAFLPDSYTAFKNRIGLTNGRGDYRRGYRNFLFFVNSAQIIEKTKENFLNPASAKHLFAPGLRIDDKPVDIRAVDTFDAVSGDAINIHFTTIQGLHTRMQAPKENAVTIEDFRDYKVVMISDEAHHLNAETKKTLTKGEAEDKASWEGTVSEIFRQHPENMLLEFTATVDLSHEAIRAKYADKILYDYSLRQFREDGYSKDIELRQADFGEKPDTAFASIPCPISGHGRVAVTSSKGTQAASSMTSTGVVSPCPVFGRGVPSDGVKPDSKPRM